MLFGKYFLFCEWYRVIYVVYSGYMWVWSESVCAKVNLFVLRWIWTFQYKYFGWGKPTQHGNKNADVKKQYITKTCFATIAMDSFRGAKPAQDKTPKTKLTNSGATLYFFLLDLRACLSIPQNQAPQVPSRTQRNQQTLLGKETRPIRTYFTSRHAKPTLQNVFISCIGFEVQRSSCEFMGAHCSFNLCSWVFMCLFFGCHPVIEFPKTRLVCWLIFLLFDCKNCVLVTSCRSRSDCSSTGWLFLEWNLETAKPQIFGKTQVWRALFEISLNAAQRGCFFGGK